MTGRRGKPLLPAIGGFGGNLSRVLFPPLTSSGSRRPARKMARAASLTALERLEERACGSDREVVGEREYVLIAGDEDCLR